MVGEGFHCLSGNAIDKQGEEAKLIHIGVD